MMRWTFEVAGTQLVATQAIVISDDNVCIQLQLEVLGKGAQMPCTQSVATCADIVADNARRIVFEAVINRA
jgi:chaperone required for assembly of F1-ATPase